jgi:hypothetical protein
MVAALFHAPMLDPARGSALTQVNPRAGGRPNMEAWDEGGRHDPQEAA